MIIGIPRGLLYYRYHTLIVTFFKELGVDIILSPDTSREILDLGIKYCVDEACLPVKVFHGHVAWLRDKCSYVFVPRIMQLKENEFICPKFCGLPEMIVNSFEDISLIGNEPLYNTGNGSLYRWLLKTGLRCTKSITALTKACNISVKEQKKHDGAKVLDIRQENGSMRIAVAGHGYNVFDSFTNMDFIERLRTFGAEVLTEDMFPEVAFKDNLDFLYKKPFWNFARNTCSFINYIVKEKCADGIIYVSSFGCGIDSVIIELVKDIAGNMPLMVLKLDEHTGDTGRDTRLEAFYDMLERRNKNGYNLTASW